MKNIPQTTFANMSDTLLKNQVSAFPNTSSSKDNPSACLDNSISLHIISDFILKRKLMAQKRHDDIYGFDTYSRIFKGIEANFSFEKFKFVGRIGCAKHKICRSIDSDYWFKTQDSFSYCLGARATFNPLTRTKIVMHSLSGADSALIEQVKDEEGFRDRQKSKGHRLLDRNYALGIIAHQHIRSFAPYLGAQFVKNLTMIHPNKNAWGDQEPEITRYQVKNGRNLGLIFGASVMRTDRAGLSIEGRLLNERALGISGQIRF